MILLPNGMAPRKTKPLLEREMAWLAMGEDVLRKLNLTLACPRCLAAGLRAEAVLHGHNSPTDTEMSIQCECRRLVFRQKGAA